MTEERIPEMDYRSGAIRPGEHRQTEMEHENN